MKWETIAKWVVVSLAILGLVWLGIRTFTVQESPAQPAPPKVEIEMKVDVDVSSPSVFPSPPGPVVVMPTPSPYASWDEICSVLQVVFPNAYLNIRTWGTYSLPATGWAYTAYNTVTVTICRDPSGNLQVTIRDPKDGRTDVLSVYHQFRATRVSMY